MALTVVKFVTYAQDYRMMGNYHYMLNIIFFIYFFIPYKRVTLKCSVVSFYLGAGVLKLNYEWLGAVSLEPRTWLSPYLPHSLLIAMCVYVVILELGVSWFLLSKNYFICAGALTQFILFHLFSWHIVGFYYPTVMFCLLTIFPLSFIFDPPDEMKKTSDNRILSRLFTLQLPPPTYLVLGVFTIAQLIPVLNGGDSSLTSEGRMLALNMFDSRSMCISKFTVKTGGHSTDVTPQFNFGIILHCDPIVHYDFAKWLCRYLKNSPSPAGDIDVFLQSKRTSDKEYQTIIDVTDFCAKNIRYSVWGWNDWIKK